MTPKCPLCEGAKFKAHSPQRPNETCVTCGSRYRTRSVWLLLTEYAKVKQGMKIAHFAPERPISQKLSALCGQGYEAYDFDPDRYRYDFTKVTKFDLCRDLKTLEQKSYDVVIHNHVLEHVYCNYTMVLLRLHSLLKLGAYHIFSVPTFAGYSASNLDPTISDIARDEQFNQRDHVRKFGKKDFDQTFGMALGLTRQYNLSDLVSKEALLAANIPEGRWKVSPNGTVFVKRRSETSFEDLMSDC